MRSEEDESLRYKWELASDEKERDLKTRAVLGRLWYNHTVRGVWFREKTEGMISLKI